MNLIDKYGVPQPGGNHSVIPKPISAFRFVCTIEDLDVSLVIETIDLKMMPEYNIAGEIKFREVEGGITFVDAVKYSQNGTKKNIKIQMLDGNGEAINETALCNVNIYEVMQSQLNYSLPHPVYITFKFHAELDV